MVMFIAMKIHHRRSNTIFSIIAKQYPMETILMEQKEIGD
jgi:hypothetical protein